MTNARQKTSGLLIRHSSFVIAKEGAIAVRLGALAEAVTHLSWVPPTGPALVTLARPLTPAAWPALRQDPGAVLLLLRPPPARPLSPDLSAPPALLASPGVPELAARHLRAGGEARLPDWSVPGRAAVREACLRC